MPRIVPGKRSRCPVVPSRVQHYTSIVNHTLRYIVSPELCVGLLSSEAPDDRLTLLVSSALPCLDTSLKFITCGESGVQALSREDTDFDLRHVQPTCVLGRVVKPYPAQQLGGLSRSEDIDEALLEVDVQSAQHHPAAGLFGRSSRADAARR